MFKRLRNRILAVNMSIITALLLALLTVIYLTTFNRIETDNRKSLDLAARRDFFTTAAVAMPASDGGARLSSAGGAAWFRASPIAGRSMPTTTIPFSIQSAGGTRTTVEVQPSMIRLAPVDLSHSFHVIMDAEGQVFRINSYINLTEEACRQAAVNVFQSGREHGRYKTDGHTLIYCVEPLNVRYVVTDGGDQLVLSSMGPSNHRITFLDITASQKTLTQLLTTVLAVGAVGLIFIFAISFYFARRAIAPIAQSWENQKQFLADASHELKTPIAIINANSDALLSNDGETVASQRVWIDYIKAETARMSGLVNTLLDLARAEDETAAPTREAFDLSELATDAVLAMEAVAFEHGLLLSADLDRGLTATACREDIKRVLLILLDNAIKYTEPGGEIAVTLKYERRQSIFSVHNSGAGIPEELLPRLFDRFFRADPARSHDGGSFGLGLAIAKTIVEREGGTIAAESAPGEGATFTVTLG